MPKVSSVPQNVAMQFRKTSCRDATRRHVGCQCGSWLNSNSEITFPTRIVKGGDDTFKTRYSRQSWSDDFSVLRTFLSTCSMMEPACIAHFPSLVKQKMLFKYCGSNTSAQLVSLRLALSWQQTQHFIPSLLGHGTAKLGFAFTYGLPY